jgi:hypothetical protein
MIKLLTIDETTELLIYRSPPGDIETGNSKTTSCQIGFQAGGRQRRPMLCLQRLISDPVD